MVYIINSYINSVCIVLQDGDLTKVYFVDWLICGLMDPKKYISSQQNKMKNKIIQNYKPERK